MRTTARVLLIHGSRSSAQHEAARLELANCFLGVQNAPTLQEPHALSERGAPISVADANGRRVIKTRALAGQASTGEFLERIDELIGDAL